MRFFTNMLLLVLLSLCAAAWNASAQQADCSWPAIEARHRPGTYWHWMASAVDEANLTRELELFKVAGLGGIHVIPIYGAKGYEERYVEYLSPRWMALLAHTVKEAKRLGLRVDMTTGTGWNFGGPNIPDNMANALVKTQTAKVASGETCVMDLAGKAVQAILAFSESGESLDLGPFLTPAGRLEWSVPDGAWTVLALWQESSGNMVERAAPGGEGWMLNLFQGGVMSHYLERFDAAFNTYTGPMPRAMYHDSYEYKCNWASDLFTEFEKRRGYRLQNHLNVFLGDSGLDEQARLKSDYRETLSDMALDNGIRVWADWAHRRGCITRNQAHGSPGNLLDLYAAADIPETEMFNKDRDPLMAKFASSASHVMNKDCTAAETGTWLREHFNVTLGDLKNLVDDLFVSGINQVLYHGTCYSPSDAPWPGWLFYASTQMNPRNAFWRDVPILNGYIARCQVLFQESQPDNDVLVYWPIHDLWHDPAGMEMGLSIHRSAWLTEQPVGRVARLLWEKGYAFDYISDQQLNQVRAGESGLIAPGGAYRAVLVPRCTRMPLQTMECLRALAEAGATVLFENAVPADVPGLANLEERRAVLSGLTHDFARPGEHALGKGRVVVAEEVEALLGGAGVSRETLADTPGLLHIRRKEAEGTLYFLANRGSEPITGYVPLARSARGAVLLDPMSGKAGTALLRDEGGSPSVRVDLAPGHSIFVRTFQNQNPEGPAWQYLEHAGEPRPVEGTWRVEFIDGGPEPPPFCEVGQLVSWTEIPDSPGAAAFAGTARYTVRFDAGEEQAAGAWRLDLGGVAESARVRLNGLDLGALILPPWTVNVPAGVVNPQDNLLEIEVTNLSANRIRDLDQRGVEWRIFNDINFVNIDYKPFDASVWPLRPSGLLGPVTLTPLLGADSSR